MSKSPLRRSAELSPAEPLWKRAPTRDEDGRLLTDFLMIVPGLRRRTEVEIRSRLAAIEQVLMAYREHVVFADVNLRLNTLWVTVRPVPGICLELPAAIKVAVPEALLVGQQRKPDG
jgi:hypothetical protein